jgi:hypothetical protein
MNSRLVLLLAIAVLSALAWVEGRIGLEFLLPITIVVIIAMLALLFFEHIDRDERKAREHPTTNH